MHDDRFDFDAHRSLAEVDDAAALAEIVPLNVLAKPLRKLNAAELCGLLTARAALRFAVPLAIAKLADNPLAKVRHEGDLLTALLEAPREIWIEHPAWWEEAAILLAPVLESVTARAESEGHDYLPFLLGDDFMAAVMHFRECAPA